MNHKRIHTILTAIPLHSKLNYVEALQINHFYGKEAVAVSLKRDPENIIQKRFEVFAAMKLPMLITMLRRPTSPKQNFM
jgi:hypothetical protein